MKGDGHGCGRRRGQSCDSHDEWCSDEGRRKVRLEGSVRQVRVGVSSGYLAEKTDDRRRREHGWIVVRLYEQVDRVVESGIGSMQGPARPSGGRRKISTAQEMFGSDIRSTQWLVYRRG